MNIARRTLHLSSMMLTAIMLVGFTSCASEEFFLEEQEGKSLSIQVATTGQAQTRSVGEEDLNENLLSRLDYFFFQADANNNATGTLVAHLTETDQNDQIDHIYSSSLSDAMLTGLFGSTSPADGVYCYIYVVTNFNGFTDDNITVGTTTLADIQNITFSTTLSTNAAQPSFVMAGGSPVQLRIVNGVYYRLATSRPIPVTRAAAKIDLVVNEVQQYTEEDPNDHSKWESKPESMYVMFYNGMSKSYIYSEAGHYFNTPASEDYFSVRGSNMRQMMETEEGSGKYEHTIPFYSYMSNWSNDADHTSCLILVLPWRHVDSSGNPIGDSGYQSTYYQIPTSLDKRYLENHYYQIQVNIGMIGSFELPEPVELKDNTYMVVDWGALNVSSSVREAQYLIVETNQFTINNEPSGSVPYISSHTPVTAEFTRMEFYSYYDSNDRYLRVVYTRNKNNNGTWANTWTRTVYDGRDNSIVTGNGYASNNAGNPFTLNNSYKGFPLGGYSVNTNNNFVTITHEIPSSQFSPVYFTVEVTNGKATETIDFTQYPAIYITAHQSNGYVFVNAYGSGSSPAYDNGTSGWFGTREGLGNVRSRNEVSGSGENNNRNLYTIHITSFSDDSYIIGDPRTGENFSLTNIPTTNYWPTKSNYPNNYPRVATAAHDDTENMIAPEFMIASSYGVINSSHYMTYDRAKKRCAAYQEDGYPAGRWRMPTAAEVKYIMTLHAENKIPSMFNLGTNDGEGYWCGNGKISGDANAHPYLSSNTDYTAVRCVYDIWYWGEQPYNNTHSTTWQGYHD